MREQWDERAQAFRCHYTRLLLSEDPHDSRFVTWEHRQPGEDSTAVLVAHLVNHMKSDLGEEEFRRVVTELALTLADPNHTFDEAVLPSRPWRPAWSPT
jgi:hypothetical protein